MDVSLPWRRATSICQFSKQTQQLTTSTGEVTNLEIKAWEQTLCRMLLDVVRKVDSLVKLLCMINEAYQSNEGGLQTSTKKSITGLGVSNIKVS